MSEAVLISIQPQWCEKIAFRDKSLEVRKTKPNIPVPFKCYIYQTRRKWWYKILEKLSSLAWARTVVEGRGKVIGEFTCDDVKPILADNFIVREDALRSIEGSCLTIQEAKDYAGWKKGMHLFDCKPLYGWHISNLVIYDKPKPLNEFYRICDEWEKERFTQTCRRCYNYERNDADMCYVCCIEGEIPVERPPQSWCYVEEK